MFRREICFFFLLQQISSTAEKLCQYIWLASALAVFTGNLYMETLDRGKKEEKECVYLFSMAQILVEWVIIAPTSTSNLI